MNDYVSKNEVRVQLLTDGNFNEGKIFKVQQGTSLQLQRAPRLVHEQVRVFCNMPPNGTVFERSTFFELAWAKLAASLHNDDFNDFVSIECKQAGCYEYFFTLNGDCTHESSRGACKFLVEPRLCLQDGSHIDLDSLQMQTVLPKLLGPLSEWKSRLEVAKQAGYNIIHFTPVQDLRYILFFFEIMFSKCTIESLLWNI